MLVQLVTLQLCARTAAALGGPALPPKLRAIEQSLRGAHDAKAAFRTEELFRGCDREQLAPAPATVARGAVPGDLRGAILRNGPNARPWGSGGGWLDGDGMVHAVVLGDEGATYSRAWLRTAAFAKEEAAGPGKLFDGSLVAPQGFKLLVNLAKNFANALQPQKDTANTALVALADGRCLGLMEQCKPCEFRISSDGTLETLAAGSTLGGGIEFGPHPLSGGALTAHFHGDPVTEELVGVTYSSTSQPYGRVDFLDSRTGEITRTIGVDMRSPVMLHDSAISRKHVIILDLPLTVRPARVGVRRLFERRRPGTIALGRRGCCWIAFPWSTSLTSARGSASRPARRARLAGSTWNRASCCTRSRRTKTTTARPCCGPCGPSRTRRRRSSVPIRLPFSASRGRDDF